MSAKQTFAKLTEDLEQLEKSEKEKEVTVEEQKAPVAEPETVEPVKEEPVVEEPVKEEDPKEEPKAEEPEVEPKAEPVVEPEVVEPVKEEPVVEPVAEEPKEEPKEEPVSKSEEIETGDILKAFEAVVKSNGNLHEKVAGIEKTLATILEALSKSTEVVETPAEEPTTEEAEVTEVEEEVAKSAEQPEEEELDGKAVEFVSKSNGVPEIEGTEPQVEEEVVEPFNPQAHVDKMLRYYEEKSNVLSEGAKDNIRSAVHRIKRGQPTGGDTKLAEQIYNFYEN
ncbi:hypothetical protein BCP01_047 [Bacillus phage BCP01]|nr:hypothetical protein BCP01_047 [Bacillus phage BCP01]